MNDFESNALTPAELLYARTHYSFACWQDQHADCEKCCCECHLIDSFE